MMQQQRLLIIEGEPTPQGADIVALLGSFGSFTWRRAACEGLAAEDLHAPQTDGVLAVTAANTPRATAVLDWLRAHPRSAPTAAVLPPEPEESLLRLAAATVDELIFTPLRPQEVRHRLERLLGTPRREVDIVRQRILEENSLARLVGSASAFVRVLEQLPAMARNDAPVLITGETGTGKELCARAIHHLSPRRTLPFIAVDCGAIPDHLFENELFGHVRGAFTDAHRDQKGLVAMADGGTLFLDEVDALSAGAQAKLLRLLQERTYRPLGGERFCTADVRVLAATNRDLEACVEARQVRSDLYYRLNVLRAHLPPLRERSGDIEELALHFLRTAPGSGSIRRSFSPGAMHLLQVHAWPGNVRELFNVVQRAAVLSTSPRISREAIQLPGGPATTGFRRGGFREARASAVASFEADYIATLLRRHGGNVTRAAREACKDRRVFGRLMKKYGIVRNTT